MCHAFAVILNVRETQRNLASRYGCAAVFVCLFFELTSRTCASHDFGECCEITSAEIAGAVCRKIVKPHSFLIGICGPTYSLGSFSLAVRNE